MTMRVAAIIQARMGSERLEGKVLQNLAGYPMLWHVVERVKRSLAVEDIIVATTDTPGDTVLVDECQKWGVAVFRGYELDVLGRYYMASQITKSNVICRVTADNPLVEPGLIDMAFARMQSTGEDYIGIDGCPLGTGIELLTRDALNYTAFNADKPFEREHVTPYIRSRKDVFKIGQVDVPLHFLYPEIRLTVDTKDDFALMEVIYRKLYREGTIVRLHDVIQLLLEEPALCQVNAHIKQKGIM